MSGERPRIGLLGGTFDPVHLGHLIVGEEAAGHLELDRVLFVPSRHPWRKAGRDIAPEADRVAMVELAVAGNPRFGVSRVDLEREGPTYSVDTVADIRREAPDANLYFIIGYDALLDLPNWRSPERLAAAVNLVAMVRPGYRIDWGAVSRAIPGAAERITVLQMPVIGISSSEVRRRVADGDSVRYWVPDAVAAYIAGHGLYRDRSDR